MMPNAFVILSPGFPAGESDTTCLPNQQIFVKTLAAQNPDLKVIVIAFQYPYKKEIYNWHNVEVISLNGRSRGHAWRRLTWLKAGAALHKLNKIYRITGVLSFWLDECALVGDYMSRRLHLKHRIWLLGQDARPGNKYVRRLQPPAERLIALSDFVVDEYERNYKIRPAHVIPVGIDTSLFGTPPSSRSIDIIGVGSLIPLKQYDMFIEAVRFAAYYFPNLQAVICGKGIEEEKLRALIEQYNLSRNIKLLGEVPHNEVLSLMQASKVFLHTANYEGFGAVIAEALYAGTHVISFSKPMTESFPNHHLVQNVSEMQTRLVELLKQPMLDHTPVLTYTVEDVAAKMMSLFNGPGA